MILSNEVSKCIIRLKKCGVLRIIRYKKCKILALFV